MNENRVHLLVFGVITAGMVKGAFAAEVGEALATAALLGCGVGLLWVWHLHALGMEALRLRAMAEGRTAGALEKVADAAVKGTAAVRAGVRDAVADDILRRSEGLEN